MEGCPHCLDMKKQLIESRINFVERDINQHEDEYDLFVSVTNNEYVPAFMVIEDNSGEYNTYLYAPERDYNEINEGIEIIKEHLSK